MRDGRFLVVPHGVKYPSSRAMHVWVEGDEVLMCNESGGFVRRVRTDLPLLKFLKDWNVVTKENTEASEWREATMDCAEMGYINGYVIGRDYGGATRWNGWACPAFPKSEIERVISEHPDTYGQCWKFEGEVLLVWDDNEGEWEPEKPGEIMVEDEKATVYTPGYMSWCWEEVTPRLCHCGNDLEDVYNDELCHGCEKTRGAVLATGQSLPPDEMCPQCDADARDAL